MRTYPERGALDACAEVALRSGSFAVIAQRDASRADNADARFEPKKRGPFTAERNGGALRAPEAGHDNSHPKVMLDGVSADAQRDQQRARVTGERKGAAQQTK